MAKLTDPFALGTCFFAACVFASEEDFDEATDALRLVCGGSMIGAAMLSVPLLSLPTPIRCAFPECPLLFVAFTCVAFCTLKSVCTLLLLVQHTVQATRAGGCSTARQLASTAYGVARSGKGRSQGKLLSLLAP